MHGPCQSTLEAHTWPVAVYANGNQLPSRFKIRKCNPSLAHQLSLQICTRDPCVYVNALIPTSLEMQLCLRSAAGQGNGDLLSSKAGFLLLAACLTFAHFERMHCGIRSFIESHLAAASAERPVQGLASIQRLGSAGGVEECGHAAGVRLGGCASSYRLDDIEPDQRTYRYLLHAGECEKHGSRSGSLRGRY